MKKLLITLMLGIFLISMASAYSPHKLNTNWNVVVGSNNATACNISYLQYPDNSIVYFNGAMNKDGQSFNYTMTWDNFTNVGDTCAGITCTDGVTEEVGSVCRAVNPSGFANNIAFYFVVLILSLGLIVFGHHMEDNWVIVLGGFGLIFLGMYIMFYGIIGLKDGAYTFAISLITLFIGGYFSVRGAYEQLFVK